MTRTKDMPHTHSRNRVLCCWLKVLPVTADHIIEAETMQQACTPLMGAVILMCEVGGKKDGNAV